MHCVLYLFYVCSSYFLEHGICEMESVGKCLNWQETIKNSSHWNFQLLQLSVHWSIPSFWPMVTVFIKGVLCSLTKILKNLETQLSSSLIDTVFFFADSETQTNHGIGDLLLVCCFSSWNWTPRTLWHREEKKGSEKTMRVALRYYKKSSFYYLFHSGNDQSLLNCCAVDHRIFRSLLKVFEPVFHEHMACSGPRCRNLFRFFFNYSHKTYSPRTSLFPLFVVVLVDRMQKQ